MRSREARQLGRDALSPSRRLYEPERLRVPLIPSLQNPGNRELHPTPCVSSITTKALRARILNQLRPRCGDQTQPLQREERLDRGDFREFGSDQLGVSSGRNDR
jgi:hypothetical protein